MGTICESQIQKKRDKDESLTGMILDILSN